MSPWSCELPDGGSSPTGRGSRAPGGPAIAPAAPAGMDNRRERRGRSGPPGPQPRQPPPPPSPSRSSCAPPRTRAGPSGGGPASVARAGCGPRPTSCNAPSRQRQEGEDTPTSGRLRRRSTRRTSEAASPAVNGQPGSSGTSGFPARRRRIRRIRPAGRRSRCTKSPSGRVLNHAPHAQSLSMAPPVSPGSGVTASPRRLIRAHWRRRLFPPAVPHEQQLLRRHRSESTQDFGGARAWPAPRSRCTGPLSGSDFRHRGAVQSELGIDDESADR